jgi:hypothetical protein
MSDAEQIILVLQPMSDSVPVEIRLRQALKYLLRAQRLRCIRIGPAQPESLGPAPGRGAMIQVERSLEQGPASR